MNLLIIFPVLEKLLPYFHLLYQSLTYSHDFVRIFFLGASRTLHDVIRISTHFDEKKTVKKWDNSKTFAKIFTFAEISNLNEE